MLYYTHLAAGLLFGLLALPFNSGNTYIFLLFALFGAILPDIDLPHSKIGQKAGILSHIFKFLTGHRGLFHSLIIGILVSYLLSLFISQPYALALFIGFLSHILADGLTPSGVNMLHPIVNLRLSGFIKTGSLLEHMLLITLIASIVFLYFH